MLVKPVNSFVLANGDDESDLVGLTLLLLAATVRSVAYMGAGVLSHSTVVCLDQWFPNIFLARPKSEPNEHFTNQV